MDNGFHNRHDWFTIALAMAVWSAHFTVLWAASIIFPDEPIARWLALVFTIVAFVALAWLWNRAGRPSLFTVSGLGLAIAAGGTAFDATPALLM